MEQKSSTQPPEERQAWREPAIVLERWLEAHGQGGPAGEDAEDALTPLRGFLGPLSTSGGGIC